MDKIFFIAFGQNNNIFKHIALKGWDQIREEKQRKYNFYGEKR